MRQGTTRARAVNGGDAPFWRRKTLDQMTRAEWESLCDGCARCCLIKLEDSDTGELAHTDIACRLLDTESCRCSDYRNRHEEVSDCIGFDAETLKDLEWMPPSCAYRLIAEGRDLYWWHPLVSGDPETVHAAGISVRGRVCSEADIDVDAFEDHIVDWPAGLSVDFLNK